MLSSILLRPPVWRGVGRAGDWPRPASLGAGSWGRARPSGGQREAEHAVVAVVAHEEVLARGADAARPVETIRPGADDVAGEVVLAEHGGRRGAGLGRDRREHQHAVVVVVADEQAAVRDGEAHSTTSSFSNESRT